MLPGVSYCEQRFTEITKHFRFHSRTHTHRSILYLHNDLMNTYFKLIFDIINVNRKVYFFSTNDMVIPDQTSCKRVTNFVNFFIIIILIKVFSPFSPFDEGVLSTYLTILPVSKYISFLYLLECYHFILCRF